MDESLWRCTVKVFDESLLTRVDCDEKVKQDAFFDHLRGHKVPATVDNAIHYFVLHEAAYLRPKARRESVKDTTIPLDLGEFR